MLNLKEANEKLEQAFYAWLKSDRFKELVQFYQGFYNYSFFNKLLILHARSTASLCASFEGWKKFKRYVKKGEKGIPILVPRFAKFGIKGEGEEEQQVSKLVGFVSGYTFDYEQTEGEPLPRVKILGDAPDALAYVLDRVRSDGYNVVFYEKDSLENGYTFKGKKDLYIKSTEPTAQQTSTVIHEWAHQQAQEGLSKEDEEIVVQTASFFVLSNLEVDNTEYTASYIQSWSHGRPFSEVSKLFNQSDKIARQFLSICEN